MNVSGEPVQAKVATELAPVVRTVTQEKIGRYAASSGDRNPLHTDPEFAARSQFGGAVAHGMLLLAYLSEMLTAAFGLAWLSSGRLKVRFRAPARPGDVITTSGRATGRHDGWTLCEVACHNQSGELLVSGEARVQG